MQRLPDDGTAHGFDNIGEALDISPVQLQRYMEAAGKALDAAVHHGPRPESNLETHAFDTGRNQQHIGRQWLKRSDGAVVFSLDGGPVLQSVCPDRPKYGRRNRPVRQ